MSNPASTPSGSSHDLRASRRTYSGDHLDADAMPADPMEMFGLWFDEASAATEEGSSREPNAMTVSTVHQQDGAWRASARVVLLKQFDDDGLVFFTNYDSDKGRDLLANPWAAASFWWPEEARQVRFEGRVEKVPESESREYFAQRPRGSQIGAIASEQSRPLSSPEELSRRVDELTEQYEGREVPCPDNWGGFRLTPDRVEFWQGQPSRLHDRVRYERAGGAWRTERLNP